MKFFELQDRTFRWNGDFLEEAAWYNTGFPIEHAWKVMALANGETFDIPGVPGAALRWEDDKLLSKAPWNGEFEHLGWERSHIQLLIDEYESTRAAEGR